MKFRETRSRSVVKAVIYRGSNIALDTTLVYLLTHRIELTAGIVILTNCSSTLLYFLTERVWNRVQWGRVR